jgi:hypothetical protein
VTNGDLKSCRKELTKREKIVSFCQLKEKILFSAHNKKIGGEEKRKKNFYPTAIIRAKKNDHVVAIPPKR